MIPGARRYSGPPSDESHLGGQSGSTGHSELPCLLRVLPWLRCSCSAAFTHDGCSHLLALCFVSVLLSATIPALCFSSDNHSHSSTSFCSASASCLRACSSNRLFFSSPSARPAACHKRPPPRALVLPSISMPAFRLFYHSSSLTLETSSTATS